MDRSGNELIILTVNVRGLKDHTRRKQKIDRLINLIKRHKPDVILLQETHIDDLFLARQITIQIGLSTSFHSLAQVETWTGTTTLITSDRWTVIGSSTSDTGRMITVDITRNNQYYSLVNVYAPSGTNNNDRALFFDELLNFTQTTARHDIILAGDFNVTLQDSDRTRTRVINRNVGRAELQNIVDIFGLKDTYRDAHTDNHTVNMTYYHLTSHRVGNVGSRIDRVYATHATRITHHEHINDTLEHFTDHKAVLVKINSPPVTKHCSPHYKFNDSLLDDEYYLSRINTLIDTYLYPISNTCLRETWDFFKDLVKQESIAISKVRHRNRLARLKIVQQEVDDFYKNNYEETDDFLALKDELEKLLEYKYQGALIRSRQKLIGDETATSVFVSLESNIQRARQIQALEDENGVLHTDNDKIMEMLEDFYRDLFTREPTDGAAQDYFLQFATRLTDEQRDTLEIPLTQTHLKESLNTLDITSSPGPDGLTYSWYKTFFDKIAPFFMKLIDECLEHEFLSQSQNLNFLSLMLKDPQNPHLIKNYRPLALLNTDYKIMTKALAIRTSQVMHIVINSDQGASVKGRKITDINHYIRDIIIYAEDKQLHTSVLSIDQMKAFDRVDHTWLHRLLEHMNFGPYFRKFVRTLYAGAVSCVLANHTLSNVFEITRSVRQGDPLSGILYVITLEPFLECIRQDKEITGIRLPRGIEQKLVAFADDVGFFPSNYVSIRKITKTSAYFGKASGSKINIPKTKIMALGSFKIRQNDGLNWVKEMKMLGAVYTASKNEPGAKTQWDLLAAKIRKTSGLLKYKNASIFGRAVLSNTLLTPKLNYLIQTLDIPKKVNKKIKTDIRQLIFNGAFPKISHSRLIQPKLQGGINLQDLESKIVSYRIHHLHIIINNLHKNPIGKYYLALSLRDHIAWENNTPHCTAPVHRLPTYYKNLVTLIRKHNDIAHAHTSTKITYQALIKTIDTPLGNRELTRAKQYSNFDYLEPFENLHKKILTPQQKNVTYRLLFEMTPTSQGIAIRTNRVQPCPICLRTNIQETEQHLFYQCSHIQSTKHTLITHLISDANNTPAHYNENAYKAIFLNTLPLTNAKTTNRQLAILGIYRHVIWLCRLEAKFKRKKFTQQSIKTRFKTLVDRMEPND